jgi:ribonuclease D
VSVRPEGSVEEPVAEVVQVDAVPVLTEPRDGVPPVLSAASEVAGLAARVAAGTGPVALDAERASGFRYSQRAYLVQLRRAGTGSALVDPIPTGDLSVLGAAIGDAEWVLHAANQDLACLAEVGLRPVTLFDTELAGRLLGFDRVGLAAMTTEVLGTNLRKEHSAADWSMRPLPPDWLVYATLDVELLIDLRDALAGQLADAGKDEWARQEFAALVAAPPAPPRVDPWRRTSGMHALRRPRQLATVREMWLARDEIARSRDIAPGRILPDRAIVDAAAKQPESVADLTKLPVFAGRANRAIATTWFAALQHAAALAEDELPPAHLRTGEPPPTRVWADREPAAAGRFGLARPAMLALAAELRLPVENLLSPDLVRRLCWSPPAEHDRARVGAWLTEHGARPWQVQLTADLLTEALT